MCCENFFRCFCIPFLAILYHIDIWLNKLFRRTPPSQPSSALDLEAGRSRLRKYRPQRPAPAHFTTRHLSTDDLPMPATDRRDWNVLMRRNEDLARIRTWEARMGVVREELRETLPGIREGVSREPSVHELPGGDWVRRAEVLEMDAQAMLEWYGVGMRGQVVDGRGGVVGGEANVKRHAADGMVRDSVEVYELDVVGLTKPRECDELREKAVRDAV